MRKEQKAMAKPQGGEKGKAGKAKGSKGRAGERTISLLPTRAKRADKLPDAPKGKVDLVKAMQLRSKGASYQDIANVMGCSKQGVQERLTKFMADLGDPEEITAFKDIEVRVQDAIRLKYSKHMLDDEVIKRASPKDAAIVYGTIYDKRRLETGQSTSNQSVFFHIVTEACEAGE